MRSFIAMVAFLASAALTSPTMEASSKTDFQVTEPPLVASQDTADVSSAPVDPLSKRAAEGVHIGYCYSPDTWLPSHTIVYYCDTEPNCKYKPSAQNLVVMDGERGIPGQWGVTFSSNVVFEWTIRQDAWDSSVSSYSFVGVAKNNYRNFDCYKDDGRTRWHLNSVNYCTSWFYCV